MYTATTDAEILEDAFRAMWGDLRLQETEGQLKERLKQGLSLSSKEGTLTYLRSCVLYAEASTSTSET